MCTKVSPRARWSKKPEHTPERTECIECESIGSVLARFSHGNSYSMVGCFNNFQRNPNGFVSPDFSSSSFAIIKSYWQWMVHSINILEVVWNGMEYIYSLFWLTHAFVLLPFEIVCAECSAPGPSEPSRSKKKRKIRIAITLSLSHCLRQMHACVCMFYLLCACFLRFLY